MFQRKVHGENQQKLFHMLNVFHTEKLLCLSHTSRTFSEVSMLETVSNFEIQTELNRTQTVQEMEYRRDMNIKRTLEINKLSFGDCTPLTITRSINLQMKSVSELDELVAFATTVGIVSTAAKREIHQDLVAGSTNNKTRYRTLRKCQHRLTLCASMGTYLLDLATLHFLTGNYLKAQEMCGRITSQPSYFAHTGILLPQNQAEIYKQQYCGKGYTSIHKLNKIFTDDIHLRKDIIHLPHLRPEISRSRSGVWIPPLPYAAFLSFMSCNELKDRIGCDVSLRNLIQVKYDDLQGGHSHWIVYTLLGLCYQTFGDYPRAIRAYWDSAQTKTEYHEQNPALERIAAIQRFNTE
ncbi:hypothetical protein KP79_PYT24501 [Mizuhopecten yessoensis]|uniref:Uncharacterized protein n=2 Tax=Mizuhopecten yessoensis TaxID=6573 RepID=A0A210QN81_MIZYE|nr:hypothetical protein KP79_PYT24501 [Mizuhopecten yessoensis]